MQTSDLPFNVELMLIDKQTVRNMRPVTSGDIMQSSGQKLGPTEKLTELNLSWQGQSSVSSNLNPDGLFSTEIFGPVGDERRDRQFSYIDVKVPIFHPIVFRILGKIKTLYKDIMSGKAYAVWNNETKDFEAANEVDGDTGYLFFVNHWQDIKFRQTDSPARKQQIEVINQYRDRAMSRYVLVLPAGLRDIRQDSTSRLEFDEINDSYRRIVSLGNTIASGSEKVNSKALNYSRYQLQLAFNEVYKIIEGMLRDKSGFIQRRWARRRVFDSTRNVISSMDTSKRVLGDANGFRTTDTVLGLFQTIAGCRPLAIHLIRNSYLPDIFDIHGSGTDARLVNPKTLQRENVSVKSTTKDRWTTIDGLQKVISSFRNDDIRHKPVMVEGYYLALIYKGPDKTFRVFGDINELPKGFEKKYVSPISLAELLYLSGYQTWNTLKVVVTRYPVTELGSVYPSDLYVKTTNVSDIRQELGPDWTPIDDDHVAQEFPRKDPGKFQSSMTPSPVRIKELGAD